MQVKKRVEPSVYLVIPILANTTGRGIPVPKSFLQQSLVHKPEMP